MAVRRNRFVVVEEILDERDRTRLRAQRVGIERAAGQHQAVVTRRACRIEIEIDLDLVAPVLFPPALDRFLGERNDLDGRASFQQCFPRFHQFGLLEAIGRQDCESLALQRSEEHTSELQSLMRISYAVFCLKKKTKIIRVTNSQTDCLTLQK